MRRLFVILGTLVFASCVPIRKLVPLQSGEMDRQTITRDTVLRTRPLTLKEYRIQPQDQLSINVETLTPDEYNFMKQLEPTGGRTMGGMQGGVLGYYVQSNGSVVLPVLGDVPLVGLTLFQAEGKIKELLKPLLRDPVVRVRILNFRFVFTGEVNTQITSPWPRISIVEAISMAGGLTEMSDRENIKIIRQRGAQADVLYVNLLREDLVSSPNFWLQQNDIIVVPPLRQRTARQYFTQNLSIVVSTLTLLLTTITLITR